MAQHTTEQIEQVITESLVTFGAGADQINRDAALEALDIDSLDLAELSQIGIEEQASASSSPAATSRPSRPSATRSTSWRSAPDGRPQVLRVPGGVSESVAASCGLPWPPAKAAPAVLATTAEPLAG